MRNVFVAATLVVLPAVALAQSPSRAGLEFRVNAYTTGGQGAAAASADAAGRFVVVWTSVGQDGSGGAIVGQRFDPGGARLGDEFVVNQFTTGAQVLSSVAAAPDGRFMVAWSSQGQDGSAYGVFARAYRASGLPAGPEFAVNGFTTDDQLFPDVAAIPGGFVVVWPSYDTPAYLSHVFGRVYNLDGNLIGSEFQVATASGIYDYHFAPAVAGLPNGAYIVTWDESADFESHVLYRVYDTGGPLGPPATADLPPGGFPPQVAFRRPPDVLVRGDGSFTLAWDMETCFFGDGIFCSEAGVRGRNFDPMGAPVGGEFLVSEPSNSITPDAQLAVSTRGVQVGAWSAREGDLCIPPGLCGPPYVSADGSVSAVVARRFGPVLSGPQFVVNTFTPGAQFAPTIASDPVGNVLVAWTSEAQDGSGVGVYAQRFGGLRPTALDADPTGNHVFEPGENVELRPTWRNHSGGTQAFGGTVSGLTGPPFATYTITDGSAGYGTVLNGASSTCVDCYGVAVTAPATRSTHWDATVLETISPDSQGQQVGWPLHIGNSFTDVPASNPFYRFIETLLHRGITAGCTTTTYCPAAATTRDAMAVFVLVAKEGAGYNPPACVPPNIFSDVPETSPFCRFVEELANRGVVGGCGGGNYCASAPVTREQMAVFVLRTLDPALEPPACVPPNLFADVPETSPYCRWVEELANRGIVAGCGGGNYCGSDSVTREQMGVFISVTFGLTLYGT